MRESPREIFLFNTKRLAASRGGATWVVSDPIAVTPDKYEPGKYEFQLQRRHGFTILGSASKHEIMAGPHFSVSWRNHAVHGAPLLTNELQLSPEDHAALLVWLDAREEAGFAGAEFGAFDPTPTPTFTVTGSDVLFAPDRPRYGPTEYDVDGEVLTEAEVIWNPNEWAPGGVHGRAQFILDSVPEYGGRITLLAMIPPHGDPDISDLPFVYTARGFPDLTDPRTMGRRFSVVTPYPDEDMFWVTISIAARDALLVWLDSLREKELIP